MISKSTNQDFAFVGAGGRVGIQTGYALATRFEGAGRTDAEARVLI